MKRIGIATFHFSRNFGASLQAYALRRWLVSEGYDAFFLPYYPAHVESGGKFRFSLNPTKLKGNLKTAYLLMTNARRVVEETLVAGGERKRQAELFDEFQKRHLGISSGSGSMRDLEEAARDCDTLIAGSDQIWNPSEQFGLDPVYFLQFNTSARRISYAASFGRDVLPRQFGQQAKDLLSGLDTISVREHSGASIVQKLTGRSATVVPDPTFLLRNYDELLGGAVEVRDKYVFNYALRTDTGTKELCLELMRRSGYKVISPENPHRRWRSIGQVVHPGPAEWLRLLRGADRVVTNSYHATVFAILFRKPFINVGLPGSRSTLSTRALELLRALGLESRFCVPGDVDQAIRAFDDPIDWEAVHFKCARLRSVGEEYLSRELR
jgi:hypothetical protein